jgi:hypothetical protein
VILVVASAIVWSIDPPCNANEVPGLVVGRQALNAPDAAIQGLHIALNTRHWLYRDFLLVTAPGRKRLDNRARSAGLTPSGRLNCDAEGLGKNSLLRLIVCRCVNTKTKLELGSRPARVRRR